MKRKSIKLFLLSLTVISFGVILLGHFEYKAHTQILKEACANSFLTSDTITEIIENSQYEFVPLRDLKYDIVKSNYSKCYSYLDIHFLDKNSPWSSFNTAIYKGVEDLDEGIKTTVNTSEGNSIIEFREGDNITGYLSFDKFENGSYFVITTGKQHLEFIATGEYTEESISLEEAEEYIYKVQNLISETNPFALYSSWVFQLPWY